MDKKSDRNYKNGRFGEADPAEDAYGDIINLPHHVSARHPQMTATERAAQFSPFSALTGLGAALKETRKQMEDRVENEIEKKDFEEC